MRKFALLWIILLLALVAGCSGGAVSPTPTASPSPPPATASASDAATAVPSAGPATCVVSPLEFPVNPHIPAVTEADHTEGPDGAPIAFIEYADFQ